MTETLYNQSYHKNRIRAKMEILFLSDMYVSRLLKKQGFTAEALKSNPEIVETYRELIKNKRICKTS